MRIEYEPRFLDEAVLRAAAARPEGRLFWRQRERAYRLPDPEERARAFDDLNAGWCERLGLVRPLVAALAEQPLVLAGIARIAVGRPPRRRDAGAELLVRTLGGDGTRAEARLLRLLFPPELLLEPRALFAFLRPELLHVADMLDPRFGYAPRLPALPGGPSYERIVRDRYRLVWNTTVAGRLVRAGHEPADARARHLAAFARAFPRLGAATARVFAEFFDDPTPTHAAIVTFVTEGAHAGTGPRPCPLCGCLTAEPDHLTSVLPTTVVPAIRADFPAWTPEAGACRQCVDLYAAAALSARATAALPGIR